MVRNKERGATTTPRGANTRAKKGKRGERDALPATGIMSKSVSGSDMVNNDVYLVCDKCDRTCDKNGMCPKCDSGAPISKLSMKPAQKPA